LICFEFVRRAGAENQFFVFRENDGVFDDVFEFADVAGEIVTLSSRSISGETRSMRRENLAAYLRAKLKRERFDVFAPFAQGGHKQFDGAEPVIQIGAEASGLHFLREIAVGRGDDAQI
jgi:hypothetical protein